MALSNWLYRAVKGWMALVALIVFMAFTAVVLPQQAQNVNSLSSVTSSPDTSLFYLPEQLYRIAEGYGEQGRQAYIQQRYTFDVVWPLIYTFFLVTTITWLYARGFSGQSGWRRANLVPLFAMLLDFLENLSTSLIMFRYPHPTLVIEWLAPIFTFSKWVLVVGSFFLLLLGVMAYVRQRLAPRQPA